MPDMPQRTRLTGIILIFIGIGGYLLAGAESITAMIPAFFGVIFIILGRLGQKEALRKHAMHGAVLLALVGVLGSFGGLIALFSWLGGTPPDNVLATVAQSLMALLCLGYVARGVKSFVEARRNPQS